MLGYLLHIKQWYGCDNYANHLKEVKLFFPNHIGIPRSIQYDGSDDDLDWRIDFGFFDYICIIKCFRSKLIKDSSTE